MLSWQSGQCFKISGNYKKYPKLGSATKTAKWGLNLNSGFSNKKCENTQTSKCHGTLTKKKCKALGKKEQNKTDISSAFPWNTDMRSLWPS